MLVEELIYKELVQAVVVGDTKKTALFYLLQTVPCILHMENRIGLKFFKLLLTSGLVDVMNGKKYGTQINVNHTKVLFDTYISEIAILINNIILGNNTCPTQWKVPVDNNKKEIGDITMDNNRTRKIVNGMDQLIDFCILDKSKNENWKEAMK